MLKKIFITIFLITILVLTLLWLISGNPHEKRGTNQPNHPDSIMTHVSSVQFNKLGNPHTTLKTPRSIHFSKGNKTFIDQPVFISFSQDEPPWHITADQGETTQGTKKIEIWGHVNIHQLSGPNSHNIKLTTTKMTFYPDRSYAETDQPVTITQPGAIVHAVGLTANLNTGKIHLLSKAQGQYAVTSN